MGFQGRCRLVPLLSLPHHRLTGVDACSDVGHGIASWDAYIYVPDPDALFEEFVSRNVDFKMDLCDNSDDLRGFEVRDINGYIIYFGRPNEK